AASARRGLRKTRSTKSAASGRRANVHCSIASAQPAACRARRWRNWNWSTASTGNWRNGYMTSSTTSAELPRHTTLPMVLTITRMVLGPVFAGLVLLAMTYLYTDRLLAGFIYALTLVIFLIAAATDWLDGYFARKLNATTALGAALDHCADKVLIACT